MIFPDLNWLFQIRLWVWNSGHVGLPTSDAREVFDKINENSDASKLIHAVGFPYIASVAWQSGLRHPLRGGLWVSRAYDGTDGWRDQPALKAAAFIHNLTPLSAATYFTLLAQGRLVDDSTSAEIKRILQFGCHSCLFPLVIGLDTSIGLQASKCGIFKPHIHDCVLIERPEVRYAAAILSELDATVAGMACRPQMPDWQGNRPLHGARAGAGCIDGAEQQVPKIFMRVISPRRALQYAVNHRPRFVEELKEFVRFPSVSAQPDKADHVKSCAAWLAGHLRKIGLPVVKVFPTSRHPIVYAEWRSSVPAKTVLIYGHYDVQPAEPLNEWHSPPFSPVVRGENIYGRGASDDKGQMFAHVKAIESYLQTGRALPVTVKCVFEGEEEIGSQSLMSFIGRNRRMLGADCATVSDMPIPSPERPAITYAVRGGLSLEMEVRGPERDLHSGLYGGAVHNPLQALCEIVGKLHDASGRVTIPGFYNRVRGIAEDERHYAGRISRALMRPAFSS